MAGWTSRRTQSRPIPAAPATTAAAASAAIPRRFSGASHGRRHSSRPKPASIAQNRAKGRAYLAGYREKLNGGVVSSAGRRKTWRPSAARPNPAAMVAA